MKILLIIIAMFFEVINNPQKRFTDDISFGRSWCIFGSNPIDWHCNNNSAAQFALKFL